MSTRHTIELFVMDVDGVMTDGTVTYTSDGQELKSFNIKDGLGIKRVQNAGIKTAIITGRMSPMVEHRASELGIQHVIQGRDDKLVALRELTESLGLTLDSVAYMGDDLPDAAAIENASIGACPADAVSVVRSKADWIASFNGGQGCVRQFCDFLLEEGNTEDHDLEGPDLEGPDLKGRDE